MGGRTAQIHRSGEGGRASEGLGGEVGSWGWGGGTKVLRDGRTGCLSCRLGRAR